MKNAHFFKFRWATKIVFKYFYKPTAVLLFFIVLRNRENLYLKPEVGSPVHHV